MTSPHHALDAPPHPLAGARTGKALGPLAEIKERVHFGRPGRQHTKLDEHLPSDHHLSNVYRFGAGLAGLGLIVFGVLGLINRVGVFDTHGDTTMGLNTNGALSVLSIAVGALLLYGMLRGGNFASSLNMVLGICFILSGFVNLALIDTGANFLAFHMSNVIFSFLMGLVLLTFGMYGRVGSKLPHDNPYWRNRNAEQRPADEDSGKPLTGRA
jgi:Domain of unknown function (DUF4383)